MAYCIKYGINCEYANHYSNACNITACVKSNIIAEISCRSYNIPHLDTGLVYSKTPEEELEEQNNVFLAENYLAGLGIQVKTNYGNYRPTYDILKELGEYLSKNNK